MAGEHRVALIADGTGPVGQRIARELIGRDWTVVLQGPQAEALQQAAESLTEDSDRDRQVAACPADLGLPADRDRLVEFVLDEFERIDLLVTVPEAPLAAEDLLELTDATADAALATHVTGPLFVIQGVANEMVCLVEAGQIEAPKIVLVNSLAAYTTSTDRAASALGAAGAAMLTRLFADRLAEHGINVYEVRAGLISTGGTDAVHARYNQLIHQGLTPIRRWGRPQDIALAVAAVASDLLPYSTGEVINVDGGFHLRRL